jgi:hypothetical protein
MSMGLLALGAAAFLLVSIEKPILERRTRLATFDVSARETATLFADVRASQQAYVAAGQSTSYWMPKVSTLLHDTGERVDTLRALAASNEARATLIEVSSAVAALGNLDKRAREYVSGDQLLMASDVVFTEAGETAAEAARQVETARIAEHQAFETLRAVSERRLEYVLGAAGGVLFLAMILLGMAPVSRQVSVPVSPPAADADLPLHVAAIAPAVPDAAPAAQAGANALRLLAEAASVCTAFASVKDIGDLKDLLARAGQLIDSSGLVVWLRNNAGGDLQAVVAYGYADQVLARMKAIPRLADNAVAAAYRSGALQVVPANGPSLGAIVAPIVSVDGCIGALTAETRAGRESSPEIQSLAAIFAAQLAAILGNAATATDTVSPARAQSA